MSEVPLYPSAYPQEPPVSLNVLNFKMLIWDSEITQSSTAGHNLELWLISKSHISISKSLCSYFQNRVVVRCVEGGGNYIYLSIYLSIYISIYIYVYRYITLREAVRRYRGTSLIRNTPLLGPCSGTIPRVPWWC